MTQTHTPGPWTVDGTLIRHGTSSRTQSNVIAFDVLPHNARLIAAAPDMLAALRLFCRWNDENRGEGFLEDVLNKARAAIAKVEGGTP